MLPKLNDDCWLNILKYVELKEKLALATVFEAVNNIVKYQWRHLKNLTLDCDYLANFEQQPGQLEDFLECASESVQNMVLKKPYVDILECYSKPMQNMLLKETIFNKLRLFRFPNMQSLDWNTGSTEETEDDQVLLFTQLFPNLIKLTLCCGATGLYLSRWSRLQELHMTYCDLLQSSTFPDIFGTLPLRKVTLLNYALESIFDRGIITVSRCATLEELVIDDYVLANYSVLPNLMQLPRFRCLAFNAGDEYSDVFRELATCQPLRIETLIFNYVWQYRTFPFDLILEMKNLRSIVLFCKENTECKHYFTMCVNLPKLEELHLINKTINFNEAQLLDLVEKPHFNLLNLSECRIGEFGALVIERILELRKANSPLTLNLHNSKLSEKAQMVVKAIQKIKYIEISFEPIIINFRENFTEVQFYPNNN